MISCCHNCNNRHFRCHGECEIYRAALEKNREAKDRRNMEYNSRFYDVERGMKIHERMRKKSG